MADWTGKIQNLVDGGILNAVSKANSVQGLWYWREGVRRALQDYRETGTPGVFALSAASTAGKQAIVSTSGTMRLFGVVYDNTGTNTFWLQISDLDSGSFTLGTTAPNVAVKILPSIAGAIVFAIPMPANATNGGLTAAVTTTATGATQTNAGAVFIAFVYTT
jgi:hypothetical protein